jgi:hypothetical protein
MKATAIDIGENLGALGVRLIHALHHAKRGTLT